MHRFSNALSATQCPTLTKLHNHIWKLPSMTTVISAGHWAASLEQFGFCCSFTLSCQSKIEPAISQLQGYLFNPWAAIFTNKWIHCCCWFPPQQIQQGYLSWYKILWEACYLKTAWGSCQCDYDLSLKNIKSCLALKACVRLIESIMMDFLPFNKNKIY